MHPSCNKAICQMELFSSSWEPSSASWQSVFSSGAVLSPGLSTDQSNGLPNIRTWQTPKPFSEHPLLQHHSTNTPTAIPQFLSQASDQRAARKVLVQPQPQAAPVQAVSSSLPPLEPPAPVSPTQETAAATTSQQDTTRLAPHPSQMANHKSISVINPPSLSPISALNHKATVARGVWVLHLRIVRSWLVRAVI